MRRSPAHCIEYAHLIQWGRERPDEEFDADIEEHMKWMYEHALARASEFGIQVSLANAKVVSTRKESGACFVLATMGMGQNPALLQG